MAFGNASERLAFVLQLDAQGAIRGFGQLRVSADRNLGAVDNRLDRIGGQMQMAGAGAVAFAGVAGRALYGFAQAAEDANLQQVKLQNSIENSPELAGETADRFLDLADAIQSVTAADGDQIVAAEAMLGTFHLTGDEIERVTPLVVDYARKFDVDLVSAATQVGKALSGNIATLQRNGIVIDENAYATDRFNAVTSALRENVGGFAEQEGATFAGQMERLKNELGDVAEGIGVGVVGAFNDFLAGPAGAFTGWITDTDSSTQSFVGRVGTIGTLAVGAAGGLSLIAGSALKMRDRFTDATGAVNNFGRAAQFAAIAASAAIVAQGFAAIDDEAQRMAETFDRDIRNKILDPNGGFADFAADIGVVDSAIKDFASDIDGLPAFWDIDKDEQTRQGLERLRELRPELEQLEQDIRSLAEADGISLDAATRQVLADEQHAETKRQLAAAVGEDTAAEVLNAGAVDGNTEAHKRAREEIDRNKRAYDELAEARQAALGLEVSEERAHLNRMRAEQRLAEVMADPEATAIDIRDAELSVIESHMAVGDAARERAEAEATAAGQGSQAVQDGAQAQIDALLSVSQQLAPDSELRKRLDGYIWQLAWLKNNSTIKTVLTIEEQRVSRQAQYDAAREAGVFGGAKSLPVNVTVNAYGRLTTEEYAAAREAGRAAGREALNELGVRVN